MKYNKSLRNHKSFNFKGTIKITTRMNDSGFNWYKSENKVKSKQVINFGRGHKPLEVTFLYRLLFLL